MDTRTLFFLLSLTVSLPLSTLYILQMILIVWRSATFNSSFYRIFFVEAVVDLAFYWLTVLLYVIPNLPFLSQWTGQFVPIECDSSNDRWREEYRAILSVFNSLMFFLPAIQDGINVLIAINRFTAIVTPMHYLRLFTPLSTNFCLMLAILSGFIPSFLTVGAAGEIIAMRPQEIYMLYASTKIHFKNNIEINRTLLVSIHLLVTNCISFVLYCITTVYLRRSKFNNINETRLLILGFVILLCNTPSIAYQTFFAFYKGDHFGELFLILPFFSLVKALNPPLIMIITDSTMRKSVKSLIGFSTQISPVQTRITDQTSTY